MSQDKISNVLYIAGLGRSGSTILDMLLGQIDGFFSTGELRFIWSRGFGQNQLCGCGKPFKECDFWIEVVKEAFGGFQHVNYEMLEDLRYSAEYPIFKWLSYKNGSDSLSPYKEYFNAYRSLYQAIHKISGCEFVVDSSKNVANGFILATISEIDLYMIHLIRDSRAVAYSWQRKKVRPEIHWEQQYMSDRGILKSAERWDFRNILAHKLKSMSKQYTFLRYEDLVNNPHDSILNILGDFGIKKSSLDFLDGYSVKLKTSHTVSGNPIRFKREEITIQADTQWQSDMSRYHKLLITLLTWPLLVKYGYIGKNNVKKRSSR